MTSIPRFAVLGHPIAHSLSPKLHQAGFVARGLVHFRYDAVDVFEPERWLHVVDRLVTQDYQGFNLTRPLKALAAREPRVRTLDLWAERTGAVNTLRAGPDGLEGSNTDAPALVASLAARGIAPRAAVVFGGGGAARASQAALSALGAAVTLAARRRDQFPGHWVALSDGRALARDADVVVNATPLGQAGEDAWPTPPRAAAGQVAVEWVYAPRETAFVREAARDGAMVVEGLELLVRQAALAWLPWLGEEGPLGAMGAAVGWEP